MLWVRTQFRWGVLDTTLCDKVCQWLATGRWFSPGSSVSSSIKTDHHEITEILLKKALNTIIIPYYPWIPRLIFSITIIPFWASFNNNWIYYSFWSFTIKLWSPPTFSIINNIPTFSNINNLMYTGLSIKGGTRYFYLPKMVFGASWF
jgi:ABC-type dipeptide/oligopeptide/nickel transport system permease component